MKDTLLKIQGIPETLIIKKINKKLKIISRYSGSLNWNSKIIKEKLKELLLY